MRAFLALLRADLLMLARDPSYWTSTLLVAVISIFVFGYLFSGALEDFPLGVADADNSAASHQVVQALREVEGIELSEGTEDEELKALRDGDRWAVIVIPDGFQEGLASGGTQVQVSYQRSNLAAATASRSTVQAVIEGINRSLAGSEPLVKVEEQGVSGGDLGHIDFMLPGLVGMSIMFGSLGAGAFLVMWREKGVLRRLRVTPLRPWLLIASQMLSLLVPSAVSAVLILVLGWLLFDLSVQGSYFVVAVVVASGALCMLGLGYLIGSRVRTSMTAAMAANLIGLPMLFLGGTYFPTDSAPPIMEPLVRIAPLSYLNDALRAVINEGAGLADIGVELGVLAAWTVGTIAVSSRIFRWE